MSHRLIATVQYRENYGDEESPYWKNKFGHDVLVAEWGTRGEVPDAAECGRLVRESAPVFAVQTPYQETLLIGWSVLGEGEMTGSEKFAEEIIADRGEDPVSIRDMYRPRTLEECRVCPF